MKVWVMSIDTRNCGVSQYAFASKEAFDAFCDGWADENWETEFPEEPRPAVEKPGDLGDAYFELMSEYGDEWRYFDEVEVRE